MIHQNKNRNKSNTLSDDIAFRNLQRTYLDNKIHNNHHQNKDINTAMLCKDNIEINVSNDNCQSPSAFEKSTSTCDKNKKDDHVVVQTLTTEETALDPLPLNSVEDEEESCITFPKRKQPLSLGIGSDQYMLPEPEINIDNMEEDDEPLPLNVVDPIHQNDDEPLPLVSPPQDEYFDSDDEDYGVYVTDVVAPEKPQLPQRSFSAPSSRRSSSMMSFFPHPVEQVRQQRRRASSCSVMSRQQELGMTRQHMIAFESSMGSSIESQKKIHDWDRKMGLKRSHSKTMRLSMKSRKKLRQLMQREIVHISKVIT